MATLCRARPRAPLRPRRCSCCGSFTSQRQPSRRQAAAVVASQFVNEKLNAKLHRQLQDPLPCVRARCRRGVLHCPRSAVPVCIRNTAAAVNSTAFGTTRGLQDSFSVVYSDSVVNCLSVIIAVIAEAGAAPEKHAQWTAPRKYVCRVRVCWRAQCVSWKCSRRASRCLRWSTLTRKGLAWYVSVYWFSTQAQLSNCRCLFVFIQFVRLLTALVGPHARVLYACVAAAAAARPQAMARHGRWAARCRRLRTHTQRSVSCARRRLIVRTVTCS